MFDDLLSATGSGQNATVTDSSGSVLEMIDIPSNIGNRVSELGTCMHFWSFWVCCVNAVLSVDLLSVCTISFCVCVCVCAFCFGFGLL